MIPRASTSPGYDRPEMADDTAAGAPERPPRRPRYRGTHPRRFSEKYKERDAARYAETAGKVAASGKTPAGTHRPILVAEVLAALDPKPGEVAVDATLGYGGHAAALLPRLLPGGRLIGLDVDPVERPRTEARLRRMGFGPDVLTVRASNFAGLPKLLAAEGLNGVDLVLADLGVSSMQLDDPARGFTFKEDGPLDLRMNPNRGRTAAALLAGASVSELERLLLENADEPHAALLARALAGRTLSTTTALASTVRACLPKLNETDATRTVRRVFQALRIAVNEELSVLETLLRQLPQCLRPGGRAAILTFHSGEDRRVKKAFEAGLELGDYREIASEVIRPSPQECHSNPRATPAKLRWARR